MNNNALKILLNENKLMNTPVLIVCKAIIHEAIHAKITLDLLKIQKGPVGSSLSPEKFDELSDALTEQNFPTLFDYYQEYRTHVKSQHQYMASHYVKTIANALHEFSSINYVIAQAIAWSGLKGTEAWKALPPAVRNQYNFIYNNYCSNTPKLIER